MIRKDTYFHDKLKTLMDRFVHEVYDVTSNFPKSEIFGTTSQYRRAALSVILNYVEGYARQRKAVLKTFIEISYGSMKECSYLTEFSYKRNYMVKKDYEILITLADEISRMLWGILSKL